MAQKWTGNPSLYSPIKLLDGRRIETVAEAVAVIESLPLGHQEDDLWVKTLADLKDARSVQPCIEDAACDIAITARPRP
jgi:hypothetical protein